MRCPFCLKSETFVKDSRDTDDSKATRRRRQCSSCGGKFTTFERVQLRQLFVVKRSGAKKPFDPTKIHQSIQTALRKRGKDNKIVNETSEKIILEIESGTSNQITSRKIGNMIMDMLAKIDQVAYIRFASVYKDFTNAQDFAKFINKIRQ